MDNKYQKLASSMHSLSYEAFSHTHDEIYAIRTYLMIAGDKQCRYKKHEWLIIHYILLYDENVVAPEI